MNFSAISRFPRLSGLRGFSTLKDIEITQKDLSMKIKFSTDKILKAPYTVDFNVNGKCNLDCKWCWGPDHKAKEELTNEEWKETALKLKNLGTRNITFTGGETLMKKGLDDILKYVHSNLEMRTTLSTNGILLKRNANNVLPYVDDIGLPLDGHTHEINKIMRFGTLNHFDRVIESIKLVQKQYENIELTVRTVATAKNIDSVPLIGKVLIENGVDPKKMRWKIYQVNPIGIRKDEILNGDWLISAEKFENMMEKVRKENEKFSKISHQPYERHVGRYFHIYPDGKSHVVVPGRDGFPVELPVGNIKNFDAVMKNIGDFDFEGNLVR